MAKHWETMAQRLKEHVCTDECKEQPMDDYWCPTENRFVLCPGPCNDGSKHEMKTRMVFMHKLETLKVAEIT